MTYTQDYRDGFSHGREVGLATEHIAQGTELDRMTKLADELRLALQRQQEVNETLVKALDVVRTYHPDAGYAPWESTLQVVLAALAASREVK